MEMTKMSLKDLRNCRCCMATYEKPTDFWCELPLANNETGEAITPVGFCEFCDRNNETWYLSNKDCHNNK